ncbi:hypothetical protein ATI61_10615 [Archangium gephyra]|uniref:Peptidase, M23/M37 family n=1 Tax=Archangium gephyra TaxID=48 RepID=A0AAC8Q0I6_9BACT|nr:hypothetical protein [Archangium gephyra]AKI98615.1 Peptidase, M23/M37 family [Archangium gephyra]REG30546.1 hypothetical protein ATI61_10615 [Archangium gephyra]
MKKTLAALAALALVPTAAAALDVVAPHPGTVLTTTYYSSGTFHGAVDISGNCNVDPIDLPLLGTRTWNFTIRTTGAVCTGSGSGNHNAVSTTLSDGRVLRLWHFIKTASSYDKTCDRCQLGVVGATGAVTTAQTHIEVDKNGTNLTSWYSGYTVKGEFLDRGEIIGVL